METAYLRLVTPVLKKTSRFCNTFTFNLRVAQWVLGYPISIIPLSPVYPKLLTSKTKQIGQIVLRILLDIITLTLVSYSPFCSVIINKTNLNSKCT